MPSTLMSPSAIEGAIQQCERRRFCRCRRADQRDAIAGEPVKLDPRRRAPAVVDSDTVLNSTRPRTRPGSKASAVAHRGPRCRAREEVGKLRRIGEQAIGEADRLFEPRDQHR